MDDKNSVKFVGHSGLIFTDENGEAYCIYSKTLPLGNMVLHSKEIKPLNGNRELSDEDREIIVSKILELTKHIKWQIKTDH